MLYVCGVRFLAYDRKPKVYKVYLPGSIGSRMGSTSHNKSVNPLDDVPWGSKKDGRVGTTVAVIQMHVSREICHQKLAALGALSKTLQSTTNLSVFLDQPSSSPRGAYQYCYGFSYLLFSV